MKSSRYVLLSTSIVLAVAMLGSGMAVRVGADDGSYKETVKFAEILSTVMDYYVDELDSGDLMKGAYEGMLGGLDANGAYLTPAEVGRWQSGKTGAAGPGISILKVGRGVQVVAVAAGSPAAEAGVEIGDHLRLVDSRPTRDLSLLQARRLLQGDPGTEVSLEVLRPGADFESLQFSLVRQVPMDRGYSIDVERGVAVLKITAPGRLDRDEMIVELDDLRSRGVSQLLIDLRNSSEYGPRDITALAGCLGADSELRLRDSKGRVVETLTPATGCQAWTGEIALLINGATAGAAEALTRWIHVPEASVFGEASYGLGAEPKLYELEDGAGLLVSSARWETIDGESWNETGIEPDTVVEGEGEEYADVQQDQLAKVLEALEERSKQSAEAA
jgi:carboxyl-terminal processing protease